MKHIRGLHVFIPVMFLLLTLAIIGLTGLQSYRKYQFKRDLRLCPAAQTVYNDKHLVISIYFQDGNPQTLLGIYTLSNQWTKPIPLPENLRIRQATWSPNGSFILLLTQSLFGGNEAILRVAPDGSDIRLLWIRTDLGQQIWNATVSPDESTIMFDLGGRIWSMGSQGEDPHIVYGAPLEAGDEQVVTTYLTFPSYVDGGKKLAYRTQEQYIASSFGALVMDPDGTNVRDISHACGGTRKG